MGREDTTNYEACRLLQQNIALYTHELLNKTQYFRLYRILILSDNLHMSLPTGRSPGFLAGRIMLIRLAFQQEVSSDLPDKIRTIYTG